MSVLIAILTLIIAPIVSIYLYYYSSFFKVIGSASIDEINEDEPLEEHFSEREGRYLRIISIGLFLLIGTIIWGQLAIIIGKIATEITENTVLKIITAFIFYFVFLRIPFGTGNRMIKRDLDDKPFLEKIAFAFTMIVCYILAVCCFDSLPNFIKLPFLIIPQ